MVFMLDSQHWVGQNIGKSFVFVLKENYKHDECFYKSSNYIWQDRRFQLVSYTSTASYFLFWSREKDKLANRLCTSPPFPEFFSYMDLYITHNASLSKPLSKKEGGLRQEAEK